MARSLGAARQAAHAAVAGSLDREGERQLVWVPGAASTSAVPGWVKVRSTDLVVAAKGWFPQLGYLHVIAPDACASL